MNALKMRFDQDASNRNVLRNAFEIKDAQMDDRGVLKGASSVMGVLHRNADVIFPGFFRPALAQFLKDGFVPLSHEWDGLPIGYPIVAEERGNQLYTEAEYHSHQAAQDARTVARERLSAGKSVGLSVGYLPDYDNGVKVFENGPALLKYARESGCDMKLFDVKSIQAHNTWCRALLPDACVELFEYSQTSVPMNRFAVAAETNSARQSVSPELNEWYWREDEDFDPWDDAEEGATIQALDIYHWAIWRCMVHCVRADERPIGERIVELKDHFGTFEQKCLTIIEALCQMDGDEAGATLDALKAVTARLSQGQAGLAAIHDIKPELKSAAAAIAALAQAHKDPRALENALRDAGLSKTQRVALATAYTKSEAQVDTPAPADKRSDSATPGETITLEDDEARQRAARHRDLRLRHMALEMSMRDLLGESLHATPTH